MGRQEGKGQGVDAGDNAEYLVDWGSNYADSWEPEENLHNAQPWADLSVSKRRAGATSNERA